MCKANGVFMRLIDTSHSFYQVKWRRYGAVAFPFIWTVVEFSLGNWLWGSLTGAIGLYLVWHLILNFPAEKQD